MSKRSSLVAARTRHLSPVFVCKKCLKRVDAGPEIKRALKAGLKETGVPPGKKRSRIIMTGCFGLCPKRAVVAASDTTLRRGEYLLISDVEASAEAAKRLTARD